MSNIATAAFGVSLLGSIVSWIILIGGTGEPAGALLLLPSSLAMQSDNSQ